MAVHLRLQRHGSTHRPFYHVVATDHRTPRDGRFIEKLGVYNPASEPSMIEVNEERIRHWYSHGARPSTAVAKLLKAKNIKLG